MSAIAGWRFIQDLQTLHFQVLVNYTIQNKKATKSCRKSGCILCSSLSPPPDGLTRTFHNTHSKFVNYKGKETESEIPSPERDGVPASAAAPPASPAAPSATHMDTGYTPET